MGGVEYWRNRIATALDLETLTKIDKELESLGLEGRKWRFAVVQRKNALKKSPCNHRAPDRTAPAFAAKYGVPAPDKRRLHAYRLTTEQFHTLQKDLARYNCFEDLQRGYTPGLFVLWASEWFRRCYSGGPRRWEDLAQALDLPKPGQAEQDTLRTATKEGLRLWGRPVISDGSMQYLATIAREGGFPTCAVSEGGRGWAKAVLEAIVGSLMASPTAGEAEALELSKVQSPKLPRAFSDDEFVQLCADLALEIVKIRREAEPLAKASDLPVAAWLDLYHPDWRSSLPISTGDGEADALINTLMHVEAISGALVGVERMLLGAGNGDNWHEAVRIRLDGEISGAAMADVDSDYGRLRAFAAGLMARYIPGELALFDPPGFGDTAWTARSARHLREILALPFTCPVQLDLRAGERLVAHINLPGGKPRRGQLLVAALEEGSSEAPRALRIVGSGSGNYRQAELFLRVPENWVVTPVSDGSAVQIGHCVHNTKIWRVTGGASLVDPYNDSYRVLCGQAADNNARMEIVGKMPHWAEASDAVDLFLGPPYISRNRSGELLMRRIGKREWQPTPPTLPVGHYEIGLRHEGILLDRRRLAVLPQEAEVKTIYRGKGAEYEISGFADVSITPSDDAPVMRTSRGDRWLPRPHANAVYRFNAQIEWPDSRPLPVSIAYPGEASLARWNGRVLPHGTILTLADMHDLVAVDRGNTKLLAHLRDPHDRGRGEMRWSFSREMPMSAVRADIASLLLPASLDAEVVLDMHNAINTHWHVRQFPLRLIKEGAGFVASEAIVEPETILCGRSIANPLHEISFGDYSLLSNANHRPVTLPAEVTGDWLIFLRNGDRVLTRPRYVEAGGKPMAPVSPLAEAMSLPHGPVQDQALDEFLKQAGSSSLEGAAALDELIGLVTSLRGLPPVTFNVLKKLPAFPQVLTRMAFRASEAQRDAVMDLAMALPFAWFTIPRNCWIDAANATGQAAMELLKELSDAPRYALEMVATCKRSLIERQPLLGPLFSQGKAIPLEEAAQAFVRHAIDRSQMSDGARYRNKLGNKLPEYFLRFDTSVLDALDAPCAAALAAMGQWCPSPDDIRHLKLMARTFPTWFSKAFAASLKE